MGIGHQIVWDPEAIRCFKLIFYWYKTNRSTIAANKFRKNIEDCVILIQKNPFIGELDKYPVNRSKEYRSLLSFPHHRIVYLVENKTIYITAIRDNRMNLKPE